METPVMEYIGGINGVLLMNIIVNGSNYPVMDFNFLNEYK